MKCIASPAEACRELELSEKRQDNVGPFSDPRHSFMVYRPPSPGGWSKKGFMWSVKEETEEECRTITAAYESDSGTPWTSQTSLSSTSSAPTLTKWQGKPVTFPPEARLRRRTPSPKAQAPREPRFLVINHRRPRTPKQFFKDMVLNIRDKYNSHRKKQPEIEDKGCDVEEFLNGKDKPKRLQDKGKGPAKEEEVVEEPVPQQILILSRRKVRRSSSDSICSCGDMDHSSQSGSM